jgi:serine/threonine-protein kinase
MIELVPGALVAGKYRLEREIGRGGMGSVWSARHLQLDTLVALKFVDPSAAASDAHLRFEREARAAAQLRSPHVVQILDHGVDAGLPYIAMELLEGEDLGERLRRVGRLSLDESARIFGQAAKALRRAHDAGVIHRDLKPSNIFLARFDEDEVVKLLDFGVAKLRRLEMDPQNPATQTGVIFGSPTYMSPEQARGNKAIDHRSDLWSLAVILFRALTGQKPFEASSIGDLVIKLCIEPPPVPSRVAVDLPPEVDRFFERAFARDPEQRFPSAMAMAAELEAIAQRYPRGAIAEPPSALAPRPSATPPSGLSAPFVLPPIVAAVPVAAEPVAFTPPSQPTPASLSPHALGPAPSQPTPATPLPVAAMPLPPAPILDPTGSHALFQGEASIRLAAPPSMTPSPTMVAPRPAAPPPATRTPLIAASALGVFALVLFVLVIVALRGGPSASSHASAMGSAPAAPALSSASGALVPAAPPVETAAPLPDPAASSAAGAPSADAPAGDSPAGSAAADPSGRVKPGTGKSGRGRVPNFGY